MTDSSRGSRKTQVAVFQMTSSWDAKENLIKIETRLREVKSENPSVKMVFLPECCLAMGDKEWLQKADYSLRYNDKPVKRPWLERLQSLAQKYRVWMSVGGLSMLSLESIRELENNNDNDDRDPSRLGRRRRLKGENTHIIVDDNGEIQSYYIKIHMFDVESKQQGLRLMESSYTSPGNSLVICPSSPIGTLGLSVCYDVRFPGLFHNLRRRGGAQCLIIPAAFTMQTGSAHWLCLLRARAIENQCFVIAAAQCGTHDLKPGAETMVARQTFGHACIIDPFGTIIADCSPFMNPSVDCGITCAIANIDLDLIDSFRTAIPIGLHEKPEFYYSQPIVVGLPLKSRL